MDVFLNSYVIATFSTCSETTFPDLVELLLHISQQTLRINPEAMPDDRC